MRIRICKARRGEVDGVSLDKFHVGVTYDVPPSIATYLITTGSAEFDLDERRERVNEAFGPLVFRKPE